jgi:tetratricopeptide (TPR) repeat protein
MGVDDHAGYLAGVPPELAEQLARVNTAGLNKLRSYLGSGEAVAFLGAGSSSPLYPLWAGVIAELIDAATEQGLQVDAAETCRATAAKRPDAVVELLRHHLGSTRYQAVLRDVFRVRRDPITGRTWTPTQELVCRCPFKAVVTTNYDPGIVDARMRVRLRASGTGFTSWTDELALDRWRTGDVFGEQELPVLFAHGRHNQPEAMVLATTEYRRAYAGKLSGVLARMVDAWHLVWVGFSFADQRINGVLREVAEGTGTRVDPGGPPRHVAVMAWDPDNGDDPQVLRTLAEFDYGADLVLYPTPGEDHSALQRLLAEFVADDYPPAPALPSPSPETQQPLDLSQATPTPPAPGTATQVRATSTPSGLPVRWVPPVEVVQHFTGRVEQLARLDRWAAEATVRLVGVTAWGGAGKTALVTHWLDQHGGLARRPEQKGLFGWSFYADPSADHWAEALLDWAAAELGVKRVRAPRLAAAVLALLRAVPLVLVLDGLEVLQEGPEGAQFGRLLDGTLREVLTGACQIEHRGLVVLTSRFAFADLERFDGGAARMLDVPPFTQMEGAALLAASGGGWLPMPERRGLVEGVDGHALAVAVLGSLLAERPPTDELDRLRAELAQATTTNARVAKVLRFYASRLPEADRYLVAVVGLFAHPVPPAPVLTVAQHPSFVGRLAAWTPQQVQAAARQRLAGLLSWHPDGTLSAHPLVRDTFRPLALGVAEVAADATLTEVPEGRIKNREDGLRVVEAIELLLDADQWRAADKLYTGRTSNGLAWITLPAARLGLRAGLAFVATRMRRRACPDRLSPQRLGFYLNAVGLHALSSGDLVTAKQYLDTAVRHYQRANDRKNQAIGLRNLAECLGWLGDIERAQEAAAGAASHAARSPSSIVISEAYKGWVAMLAGDSRAAEEHFSSADSIEYDNNQDHLHALGGVWWGEFLARTGRPGPARAVTDRNRALSLKADWNENVARCDRLLARLDLAVSYTTTAHRRLTQAAATFRDGDFLLELAATLPVLADCARAGGDVDAAAQHIEEAITIASPRNLLPWLLAAQASHARICANRVTAGKPEHLQVGRDTAAAAHRIAIRHRLAWQELDILDAHAHLDHAEGVDHGWTRKVAELEARLIPSGLDPDPPATVERLSQQRPEGWTAAGSI